MLDLIADLHIQTWFWPYGFHPAVPVHLNPPLCQHDDSSLNFNNHRRRPGRLQRWSTLAARVKSKTWLQASSSLWKKTSITQLWAAFPICTAHVCPDLVDVSLVLSTSTLHLSRETWWLISQTSRLQVFLFWLRKVRSLIEKTQTSKSWLVFISPLRGPMTWSWIIACDNWVYSWFLISWFGKQTKTVLQ